MVLPCEGADKFCYVCGKFTVARNSRNISDTIIDTYEYYFSKQFIRNVWWAPKILCACCYNGITNWANEKRDSLSFGAPMIWSNPFQHHRQLCYFCINNKVAKAKFVKKFVYESSPYAELPVPHSDALPVPVRQDAQTSLNNSGDRRPEIDVLPSETASYVASTVDHEVNFPQFISQQVFNDLVRVLRLPIYLGELLGSRLKHWNLLQPGVNISDQRYRQEGMKPFFVENEAKTLGYCNDIEGLRYNMHCP